MITKRFWQVDAFTDQALSGNAAAVVFDAQDLSTETMQRISREMNLSETVFLLKPENRKAHYKVRIFTPKNELPFAGHPTVASAFTVITSGIVPGDKAPATLYQECGIGLVPVDILQSPEGCRYRMTQACPQYRPVDLPLSELAAMLRCSASHLVEVPAEVVSTGVQWLIAPIKTKADVAALRPDMGRIEEVCRAHHAVGLTVFAVDSGSDIQVKVRTFAPGEGINEDPVCGSGNGSVAAYIAKHAMLAGDPIHYVAEQGEEVGRKGRVWVDITNSIQAGPVIQVGGQAVRVIEGVLEI
ncbi:MAG: PhzF family phenazine biosynthesis protein [Planctomycetota bacterium]